jgi:REP element-mobilizing transposase RayT
VSDELNRIAERFPGVSIDAAVIMPNHLHAIFAIDDTIEDSGKAPTLGEIVRSFKAAITRAVRRDCDTRFIWQRNYFERVIRDERELSAFHEYIETNPARWATDDLFTAG